MFSLTLCCFCYTVSQSYTSLMTQECQTISTSAHPKKTQDKCNAYSCYRFSKTTKVHLPTSLTYTYMSPILVIDLLFWGQIITIFAVVEFSHKDFNLDYFGCHLCTFYIKVYTIVQTAIALVILALWSRVPAAWVVDVGVAWSLLPQSETHKQVYMTLWFDFFKSVVSFHLQSLLTVKDTKCGGATLFSSQKEKASLLCKSMWWFGSENVFCFHWVALNTFPPSVLFYFTDKWQSNDKQIFKSFKNAFANFFGERKSIWYIGQASEFWNGIKREQNNLMADSVIHMDSSDYRH